MIAVDTNVLVYAHRVDMPQHAAAVRQVTELAESGSPWAIPWPCIHEFFGVVTNPRGFKPPTTRARALDQLEDWQQSPSLVLLAETVGCWAVLRELVEQGNIAGPRIHDARIAAICLVHGVRELWSADRDFSRFPSLKTRNPLVS